MKTYPSCGAGAAELGASAVAFRRRFLLAGGHAVQGWELKTPLRVQVQAQPINPTTHGETVDEESAEESIEKIAEVVIQALEVIRF
jgi:hypothetical protein